jgi:tetraacyldisaccharide 4'-kinase
METPKFWIKKYSIASILLIPIAWAYYAISLLIRSKQRPYKSSIPIICVGNITVGGAGKTPVALAIAKYLQESGKTIIFVSRGYGGSITEATTVNTEMHSALEVGDEPLLLARTAPVIISRDRVAAIKLAEKQNPDYIIMDDGMQNDFVHKDMTFMVVNGKYKFGNNRLFPAGPLRETFLHAKPNVDAIICIGKNNLDIDFAPIIQAQLTTVNHEELKKEIGERSVIAFAGIAHPEKFFDSVKELGVNIYETINFPDHYNYQEKDLDGLAQLTTDNNVVLLTTEKDLVRISNIYARQILSLKVEIKLPDNFKEIIL